MCGIVYIKDLRGRPVNRHVKSRFTEQSARGTQGFGFYMPENNCLFHNTREGRAIRGLLARPSPEVLFHHRWPTSTPNTKNTAHPFASRGMQYDYIFVHNGVVNNADDLAKAQAKLGITYRSTHTDAEGTSFNDSEALMYDLILWLEGKQERPQAKGSIAFVMIRKDKNGQPDRLYFGRNSQSPLVLERNRHRFVVASEGTGDIVQPNKLYTYHYKSGRLFTTRDIPFIRPYVYSGYSNNWDSWGATEYNRDTSDPYYNGAYNYRAQKLAEKFLDRVGYDPKRAVQLITDEINYYNALIADIQEDAELTHGDALEVKELYAEVGNLKAAIYEVSDYE